MSNQPPEETLRDGNLKATIWINEGEKGPYFTVTIAKTYKDDRGKYHDTNSFSVDDLPKLNLLTQDAYRKASDFRREHYQSLDQDNGRKRTRDSASGAFDRENGRSRGRGRAYSR